MNEVGSSPAMPKTIKTYACRPKRKRDTAAASDNEGSNGSADEEGQGETSRVKSVTPLKTPGFKRSPKKVEEHLPGPGPSPKHAKTNLMKPPSAEFTQDLHRRTGSVNSMRFAPASGSSNTKSEKPPSSDSVRHARSQSFKSIGIGSMGRTVTPDTDDVSSIAQSSPVVATIRRTEPERIKILRESEHCGDLEPHKAFCKHCSKWVNLGKQQTYALKPWEAHRKRCDQTKSGHSNVRVKIEDDSLSHADDDSLDADSFVAPSLRGPRRTESERRKFLESDPLVEQLEVDRVLCKNCKKWIKLSNIQKYSTSNWTKHRPRCSVAVPSNRVATAERKLQLVNDAQVDTFDAHSVECKSCGESVPLSAEQEYNLSNWFEHKTNCRSTPSGTAVPSAVLVARPPDSLASTSTAVASERSPNRQSLKRPRDGDHELERSPKRPRNELYVPVVKESPGPLGWFLMPFVSFVQGFRQGMGAPSSS